MGTKILLRLLQVIPTLALICVVVFFLVHLLPGSPAEALLGNRATPALVAQLEREMGLDQPLWRQLLLFFGRLLHGDLGTPPRAASRCCN